MNVNIDEVTSKFIRQKLEETLQIDLFKYKSFIDEEMMTILGQMDTATQILPHLYLGSEWNASNLDELRTNGYVPLVHCTSMVGRFYHFQKIKVIYSVLGS